MLIAAEGIYQEDLASPEEQNSSAGTMCVLLVGCTTGDEEHGQGRLSASDVSLELKAGKSGRRSR